MKYYIYLISIKANKSNEFTTSPLQLYLWYNLLNKNNFLFFIKKCNLFNVEIVLYVKSIINNNQWGGDYDKIN